MEPGEREARVRVLEARWAAEEVRGEEEGR